MHVLRRVVFVPQELLLSGVSVVDVAAGHCWKRLYGLVVIWGFSFLWWWLLRLLDLGVVGFGVPFSASRGGIRYLHKR